MARLMTRRAAITMLGGALGGVFGLEYLLRRIYGSPAADLQLANGPGAMMGVTPADMQTYMEMFSRHNEINRVVEEIPGGVRTTTESNSPDLVAKLQAHVSTMYSHLDQGAEVSCMSQSLPLLFHNADGYRRHLTITPKGVVAEETADNPVVTQTIREHAMEVSGFVRDGMPAMMQQMMGPGAMMGSR